jgi:hypothetical protein
MLTGLPTPTSPPAPRFCYTFEAGILAIAPCWVSKFPSVSQKHLSLLLYLPAAWIPLELPFVDLVKDLEIRKSTWISFWALNTITNILIRVIFHLGTGGSPL